MKSVVITGSTRGLGFGLADSFLARGCSVTVGSRSAKHTDVAKDALARQYGAERVFGSACDVRDPKQILSLWDRAVGRYGRIDIWVNNAGLSGSQTMIWDSSPGQVRTVVETNLLGLIYGAQVAVKGMLQQGHGAIYNMEGMGSDGRMHEGLVLYGMTKYGVSYFTKGLARETRGTPLVVGSIRPGMVITDMIKDQYRDRPEEWERVKRIFGIIANRIEEVTPWIVERVLENERSGVCLSYMSRWKLLGRFLLAPFRSRDLFD